MEPIHSMNKKFLTTRVLLTFSLILSSTQSWADVEALKKDILSRIHRGDKPVILMIDMQETTSKLPWSPAQAPGNKKIWKNQIEMLKFANENKLHVFDINYIDRFSLRDNYGGDRSRYLEHNPTFKKLRYEMLKFRPERYHYVVKETVEIDTSSQSKIIQFINQNQIDSAVIMGFNSDCCVRHTAYVLSKEQRINVLVSEDIVTNRANKPGISSTWTELGLDTDPNVHIFRKQKQPFDFNAACYSGT